MQDSVFVHHSSMLRDSSLPTLIDASSEPPLSGIPGMSLLLLGLL